MFSTYAGVRSKAWLAARVPLRLARMQGEALTCRLHATLVAAPVLFAHAFVPCHLEKAYGLSGTSKEE